MQTITQQKPNLVNPAKPPVSVIKKKTSILKPTCPFCSKVMDVVDRFKMGTEEYLTLACKHTVINEVLEDVELDFFDSFESYRGHKLKPFQKEGAKFGVDSNARCLIADEMGLGKTVQALAIVKQMGFKKVLIVVKAALKTQAMQEFYHWCGEDYALVRIIEDPRYDRPQLKVCPVTIISYDSLYRCKWFGEFVKRDDGSEVYIRNDENCNQFELAIIDECQQIKNKTAKRTLALKEITKNTPHIVALSGTPIKNNAAEYFSILNILHPERFNNFNQFTYRYVDTIKDGQHGPKYGGISSYAMDRFVRDTEDFIIRRTAKEVEPDLPEIWRDYKFYDLGEDVEEAYINLVKEFQNESNKTGMGAMNIIAYLNRMRVLTGIAKVDPVVDFVEEFFENHIDDDKKIAIFTHHHDCARLINDRIRKRIEKGTIKGTNNPVFTLEVGDKFQAVEDFEKPENRIFVGTTLACGEGLNMQFCYTMIQVEPEWNPANEEQTEKRFSRIGMRDNTIKKIHSVVPVALGTIDEFFVELKEKKRSYNASALDHVEIKWDESSIYKELGQMIMDKGGVRWGF